MINWNELEKYIAPGKMCILVVMIDGKEIGAISFQLDSLAYKSILEKAAAVDTNTVKIADSAEKKTEPVKKDAKKETKPKIEPGKKADPEPLDKGGDGIDESNDDDIGTIKVKETIPGEDTGNVKPLTREEIMASVDEPEENNSSSNAGIAEEISHNEHSGSHSAEEIDKGPDAAKTDLFKEDW